MFTAVALHHYAMVAAFSPTSLSWPEVSSIKPSREPHTCTALNPCGCASRGGCACCPMSSGTLLSTPAAWCGSRNEGSPLWDSRMQDTSADGFHLATPTQSGWAGVDGERALQTASLFLVHRALISSMSYLHTASETGPGAKTLAPRTLMLPGLPKGGCNSASSPTISLCRNTHLKATQSSCSRRF